VIEVRRFTVESGDILLQSVQRDAAVTLGKYVDSQRQQHTSSFWTQWFSDTWGHKRRSTFDIVIFSKYCPVSTDKLS